MTGGFVLWVLHNRGWRRTLPAE